MRFSLLVPLVLASPACSVGEGTGEASGTVFSPKCDLDGPFDLHPDYFAGEYFEKTLTITMQDGGDYEGKSDGIIFVVEDIEAVDDQLGTALPIAFDPDVSVQEVRQSVRTSLFLNESCDREEDGGLVGVGGEMTFAAIGDGSIDEGDRLEATFSIDFAEAQGDEGTAHMEGFFRFRYTRGRPAQRFP